MGQRTPNELIFFSIFLCCFFENLEPSLLVAYDFRKILKLPAPSKFSSTVSNVSNTVWFLARHQISSTFWLVKNPLARRMFHPRILLDGMKVLLQHPWQQRGDLGGEGELFWPWSVCNEVIVFFSQKKGGGGSGWKSLFTTPMLIFCSFFFVSFHFLLVGQKFCWRFAWDSEFWNISRSKMIRCCSDTRKTKLSTVFFLHHECLFSWSFQFSTEKKTKQRNFGDKKMTKTESFHQPESFRKVWDFLRFYVRVVPIPTRCFWLIHVDGGQRIGLEVSKRNLRLQTLDGYR